MFKKILFILLFTSSLFADSTFEFWIENPTIGQAYFDIFNGIIALFNSPQYQNLLYLIFYMGAFMIFLMGVLKSMQGSDPKTAIVDFSKYIIAGTLVLMLIYSNSKSTLIVEARDGQTYCSQSGVNTNNYTAFTVQMPETLGWFFASVNAIGTEMTNLAMTAYQKIGIDPNVAASFSLNSAMGYGMAVEAANSIAGFHFSQLSEDFKTTDVPGTNTGVLGNAKYGQVLNRILPSFFEQCIFYIGNRETNTLEKALETLENTAKMKDSLNDMFNSNLLISYKSLTDNTGTVIGNFPANNMIYITKIDGFSRSSSCINVFNQYIKPTFDHLTDNNTSDLLCFNGSENLNDGTLYVLTGSSATVGPTITKELNIQAGLQNFYTKESSKSMILGQIGYASGYSQSEFITTNLGTGAYMAKMLPYIQMSIRAILYAFFPFVFLVIMFPGGFSVAKNYAQTMIWVELWSPVALILNYFLSYAQISEFSGTVNSMNVSNYGSIISDANMLASVGGYLYMSVPALTYLILKGSGDMLGSLTQGVSASFSKNFDSGKINQDMKDVATYSHSGASGGLGRFESDIAALEGIKGGNHIRAIGMNSSTWANIGTGEALTDLENAGKGDAVIKQGIDKTKNALMNKGKMTIAEQNAHFGSHENYEKIGKALGKMGLAKGVSAEQLAAVYGDKFVQNLAGKSTAEMVEAIQTRMTATRTFAYQHARNNKEKMAIAKMSNSQVLQNYGKEAANDFGSTAGTEKFVQMAKQAAVQEEALGLGRDKDGNVYIKDQKQLNKALNSEVNKTLTDVEQHGNLNNKEARDIGLALASDNIAKSKGFQKVANAIKDGSMLKTLVDRGALTQDQADKIQELTKKDSIRGVAALMSATSDDKVLNEVISNVGGKEVQEALAKSKITVKEQAAVQALNTTKEIAANKSSLKSIATSDNKMLKQLINMNENLTDEQKSEKIAMLNDEKTTQKDREKIYDSLDIKRNSREENYIAAETGKRTGFNQAFKVNLDAKTLHAMQESDPRLIEHMVKSGAFKQLTETQKQTMIKDSLEKLPGVNDLSDSSTVAGFLHAAKEAVGMGGTVASIVSGLKGIQKQNLLTVAGKGGVSKDVSDIYNLIKKEFGGSKGSSKSNYDKVANRGHRK